MIKLDPQDVFKRKIYIFYGREFLQNDPKIENFLVFQKNLWAVFRTIFELLACIENSKDQQGLLLVSSRQF